MAVPNRAKHSPTKNGNTNYTTPITFKLTQADPQSIDGTKIKNGDIDYEKMRIWVSNIESSGDGSNMVFNHDLGRVPKFVFRQLTQISTLGLVHLDVVGTTSTTVTISCTANCKFKIWIGA